MSYVGRFAPSPTGPLHIGSLATAVASFLHARQASGQWLVRIEDIDPPREMPGAADSILRSLEAMSLDWDGPVRYQSSRLEVYRDRAERLVESGLAYRCSCTRKSMRQAGTPGELGPRYAGTCRTRLIHKGPTAVRVRVEPGFASFDDRLQGTVTTDLDSLVGDYVIYRKEHLPAYHLAVVVDDLDQRVTHVVRGIDLLPATSVHIHLAGLLSVGPRPQYTHVPVLIGPTGQKLSKQTGAQPIDTREPGQLAARVLKYLGASVPLELVGAAPYELWHWAKANWAIDSLARRTRIAAIKPDSDPAC